ncbi:S41 family peptidase [Candidatus Saccharibacteria bacterium]|jgi:carboxyl-terminal processing protease|nr:S41 family peptidase [Candidatus Saccharibacteria bacterium]
MQHEKQPEQTIGITKAALLGAGVSIIMFVIGFTISSSGYLSGISSKIQEAANTDIRSGLPNDLDYSSVEVVYDKLRSSFDGKISEEDALNGLKRGLVASTGDPYTQFLTSKEAAEFDSSLNGQFSGIGAELAIKNDQLTIVSPVAGTPADQAELRPGDAIIGIGEEDTQAMSLDEAVNKIRGETGTDVKLILLRNNRERIEKTITRADIDVPNATGEMRGSVGYIKLNSFGESSASETEAIAQDLKDKGAKSIVLDLRNNGGGLLDQSVDIAGLFLDNQVVVEEKQNGVTKDKLESSGKGILFGMPTIVLINEGSASASEIVAGALKDHGVAKLYGEKTFGKGSVQTLQEFDFGVLKITTAHWFTPNGTSIDKEGIKPDTEVKLTDEDFDANRDPQLEAALKASQK